MGAQTAPRKRAEDQTVIQNSNTDSAVGLMYMRERHWDVHHVREVAAEVEAGRVQRPKKG